jgi:hypothetical protein
LRLCGAWGCSCSREPPSPWPENNTTQDRNKDACIRSEGQSKGKPDS